MNRSSRLLIFGVITILIISATLGCNSGRKNFDELTGEGNEMRIYEVFGMDCPGCHDGVENLINGLSGVISSKANWEKQRLTVVISNSSEVTDEKIFDAIKRANFTPGKRVK